MFDFHYDPEYRRTTGGEIAFALGVIAAVTMIICTFWL